MGNVNLSAASLASLTGTVGPAPAQIAKLLGKADKKGNVRLSKKEFEQLQRNISISQSMANTQAINQQIALGANGTVISSGGCANCGIGGACGDPTGIQTVQNMFPGGQVVSRQDMGSFNRLQVIV